MSGIPLEPVYGPDDGEFPGVYPYTRGPYASMYRSKLWTMRMFAGFGTAEDTNWRFKEIIKAGGDGLSTAFDMPTLLGIDSDDPMSLGEVGRCGVAIDSLADMEDLYAGIDLGAITTSMTINSPAAVLLAMFVAQAEKAGIDRARLGGTLQNDILKEYQAQKEFVFPPRPSMRLVRDTITFTAAEMPRWHSVSISGYHIREAGSTAAEELAFTLANGFAYVELALQAGLPVDAFAPRLSFFFNAHIDFFEEIAKYRAARRIWARWMKERYGAQLERSMQLRFHTQTAGVSLTAQQPEVNIVRTAIEALAGVLGGTQSLHTNSMDEALALPTEKAARIALRTQQVIAHETNVAHVADPLGGSYFVEALTDEMERQAEELFAHLDELGDGSMLEGCIRGIEDNWFQGRIADSAYELERAFNEGRRPIVGVTGFTEGNDDDADRHPADHQRGRGPPAQAARPGAPRPRPGRRRRRPRRAAGRRRRPRGQPDAGADRRRRRVRHPRRDHERPRRRLRPPHRSPHHLTPPIRVFACIRVSACGTPPHDALGWSRRAGGGGGGRARRARRRARSTSRHVVLGDRLDLPADAVQLAAPLGVGGVALERCGARGGCRARRPSGRRARRGRRGTVRPSASGSTRAWCSTGTPRRRSASARTTSGCDSLRRVPPSATRASGGTRPSPAGPGGRGGDRSRRARRPSPAARASSWWTTERWSSGRRSAARSNASRGHDGDDDAVVARARSIGVQIDRRLAQRARRRVAAGGRRGGPRSAAPTLVGIRRSPASVPAVGPVTKPAGWAAHSDGAALLERRAAPTAIDEHALGDAAQHAGVERGGRCVERPTLVRRAARAVVMTPWWAASHVAARPAVRSDIAVLLGRRARGGCRCRPTVREGCAHRAIGVWRAGGLPHADTRMARNTRMAGQVWRR